MLEDRFKVSLNVIHGDMFRILDRAHCISVNIAQGHLEDPEFNLIEWYGAELLKTDLRKLQEVLSSPGYQKQIESQGRVSASIQEPEEALDLASIQVDRQKYLHLQQNAASVKGDM